MKLEMRRKAVTGSLAAIVLLGLVGSSTATSYPLDLLINGGNPLEVVCGDLLFGGWDMVGPFDPASTYVEFRFERGIYYADFSGPFSAANGQNLDEKLYYTVEATGPGILYMIDQSFGLSASGNGGVIGIGESLWRSGYGVDNVAQSSVSYIFGVTDQTDPPSETVQGDNLFINPPAKKVWVTKDINLMAAAGGYVGATVISQSFHGPMPDGGTTAMLLGFALAGLTALRRMFA